MKKKLLAGLLSLSAVMCLTVGCGEKDTEKAELPKEGEKEEETIVEPEKRELRALPEDLKYEVWKEAYTVEYGSVSLYGELYTPFADGRFPAVIFSHGYNGHYSDFQAECKRFCERGYVCYAFDFCGAQANGKSTGRTGAEYTPFTMKEDLRAAIENIKKRPEVDETQVFLFGGSQGGFVTSLVAADEDMKKELAAVALYFPAFNIPNDWSASYPSEASLPAENATIDFWGYQINGSFIRSVYRFDPYGVIGNYEGDVCIVWGDEDAIVKREFIDRAVETYGERAELTVLAGAGHGFGGTDLNTAIETVLAFLEARTYEC